MTPGVGVFRLYPSNSLLSLSLTSLNVKAPGLRTFTLPGLIGAVFRLDGLPGGPPPPLASLFILRYSSNSSSSSFRDEGLGGAAVDPEPIWSHSFPSMMRDVRNSGQTDLRRCRDWVASAVHEVGMLELDVVRAIRINGIHRERTRGHRRASGFRDRAGYFLYWNRTTSSGGRCRI